MKYNTIKYDALLYFGDEESYLHETFIPHADDIKYLQELADNDNTEYFHEYCEFLITDHIIEKIGDRFAIVIEGYEVYET